MPTATSQFQPARLVVLAANGIGTPRLLLLSKSERHPNGLANSSGLLGRNLMFHPCAAITGFFADGLDPTYRGPLGNILLSQEFYETDGARGFVRGYTFQMNRSTGPARTAMGFAMAPVAWGERHHADFAMRFGNSTTVVALGEDLPEEHNRVELSCLADRLQRHRRAESVLSPVRELGPHDGACLPAGREGAGRGRRPYGEGDPAAASSGWHLMGTARMGDDPRRSVVDHSCRAHDVDNLLRRRWQRVRDRRLGQSDAHAAGNRTARRRPYPQGTQSA